MSTQETCSSIDDMIFKKVKVTGSKEKKYGHHWKTRRTELINISFFSKQQGEEGGIFKELQSYFGSLLVCFTEFRYFVSRAVRTREAL